MALTKFGSIVTSLRGSVGGSTFQNGLGGSIMRSKPNPVKNATAGKNTIQNYCNNLYLSWYNMSAAERLSWSAFASLVNKSQKKNNSLILNGQQLFFFVNNYRLLHGIAILTTPVFSADKASSFSFTISEIVGNTYVVFSRSLNATNEFWICKATIPLRPTINNFSNKLGFVNVATTNGASQNLSAWYYVKYGHILLVGDTIGLSISIANLGNGLLLPFQNQLITIT